MLNIDIAAENKRLRKKTPIEIINKKEVLRKCPECEKYGRPGGLKIKTRKLNNRAKPGIFLGCNMYNPEYEDDELYCDYAEFNGKELELKYHKKSSEK